MKVFQRPVMIISLLYYKYSISIYCTLRVQRVYKYISVYTYILSGLTHL